MKKIAIFTSARSDFGILKNLIVNIEKDNKLNLDLIINSAHFTQKFGKTINEIDHISVKNKIYLKFKYLNSNPYNIIKYFNNICKEISNYIKNKKPDSFIIMGDRYEMLACAFTCLQFQVPIIHLCGGSITLGSLDNIYRDSISRMANLHLVESKFHKIRLNKIGIRKNVHIVGAPALENLDKTRTISLKQIIKEKKLKINFNRLNIVACFHPETNISIKENIINLKKFINFLKGKKENIIFTYPNADPGFNEYIKILKKNNNINNFSIIKNLGIQHYYSLLKRSDLLIGNSSSGIIESASFKIPTINLGNRQKNRFYAKNVLHSSFDKREIEKMYNNALSKKFFKKVQKIKNPFYKRKCSTKIINILNEYFEKNK
jgi:UDP-hydrolysing UDP-N-acetyl-D-glucosamine 2-epimerase